MKKHRTEIIQKRIHFNKWIVSFTCRSCSFPADYHREWHEDRKLAVDDARAHRFAYREIDRILEEEEAHLINDMNDRIREAAIVSRSVRGSSK